MTDISAAPWKRTGAKIAGGEAIVDAFGGAVCLVAAAPHAEGNANVLAAAPVLYRALCNLVDWVVSDDFDPADMSLPEALTALQVARGES